ncbi:MAG: excinuclease ABC subunit UvrC [Candidatus Fonsibacter lacus]|nr:excinuclease ABC subunit UvrC [Candidatus Fonsibacter lacus]
MKNLEHGKEILRNKIQFLSNGPGVYKMLDEKNTIIYVGKAKNLPNRLNSYVTSSYLPIRTERMISSTKNLEFIATQNEAEALLLEANLIKKNQPRYNILLKDDKSFPYIQITRSHLFPQITKFRGKQNKNDIFFGPFASAGSANWTIKTLQKVFLLRVCDDSIFNNRKRPCILYQIKRCSAPCTNEINQKNYNKLVEDSINFLNGKSALIQKKLSKEMEIESKKFNYEKAAIIRDRIKALTQIQSTQRINKNNFNNADLIVAFQKNNITCIEVFFYRSKQNWGNQAFFPKHDKDDSLEEIIYSFITQFYENKIPPEEIILNKKINDLELIKAALEKKYNKKINIKFAKNNSENLAIKLAIKNAELALEKKLLENENNDHFLSLINKEFNLGFNPNLIEIYDNSHIQGLNAVGSFIVFSKNGFVRKKYRKFNISKTDINPGDDYGMLKEVISRRFLKIKSNNDEESTDLIIIDGGKGHYSTARKILDELGLFNLHIIAIAKGERRNQGDETFYYNNKKIKIKNNVLLFFLQRLRDEAHRFAVFSHRINRKNAFIQSELDKIEGIGKTRKKLLLNHFGSVKLIESASIEDIKKIDGISDLVANKIYNYFNKNSLISKK